MLFVHSLRVDGAEVFRYESHCAASCRDIASSLIKLYKATHDVGKGKVCVITRSYDWHPYRVLINGTIFNYYDSECEAKEVAAELKEKASCTCNITITETNIFRNEKCYYK